MKVINKSDENGRLVYSSEIIRDIVDCALGDVEGVVKFPTNTRQYRDCIKVEQIGDDIFIDVFVKLKYNVEAGEVSGNLQSSIKSTIESMTEFKINDINVHVIEIEFEDN